MAYFPAYLKLVDKKIAIIGGGNIALEKLRHLLDFTKDITLIAKDVSFDIVELSNEHNLIILKKFYEEGDIDNFNIIIIAVDDIILQEEIYNEARQKHILCNAVDSVEYCDFIFPSYIKNGDLTISISTSGASPAVAKYLRIYIENLIPKDINIFLDNIKKLRISLPKGRERMKLLDKKVKKYFKDLRNQHE